MKNNLIKLFCLFILIQPLPLLGQELSFKETAEGILLLEDDQARYFYQTATKGLEGKYPRANYIHPLYGLNGEILTEDFPEDHFHHRGIFWTWHQLYVNGQRIADPWFCEGISWKVTNSQTYIENNMATLEAEVLWISDSLNQQAVLKENVKITYQKQSNQTYSLNFEIKLTALMDKLQLGGSEDEKGYGGFSPRIKLPEDIQFTSAGKKIIPQNLPVQAGPWMNLEGSFNGKSKSGIVIMGEPDKLPNYKGWILRNTNSMQNMAFPGRIPIELDKEKPLIFKNQLLVHNNLNTQEIDQYYKEFINHQ
ncbi:PmoA family protein [Echinicola marina]|nr:PmoA family protein [Echinicola marina]